MSSITPLIHTPSVYQPSASLGDHTERALVAINAEEDLLNTALGAVEIEGTMLAMAASMINQEDTALAQLKERLESTIKEQMNTIAALHTQIRSLDANIITQNAQFNTSKAALIQQQSQNVQRLADVTARATRAKAEEAQLNQTVANMKAEAERLLQVSGPQQFCDQFGMAMNSHETYRSAYGADYGVYLKKLEVFRTQNK